MRFQPRAKINLGLFVVGRRADGFHDLESVFWPIGWSDELTVEAADEAAAGEAILETSGLLIPADGDAGENLVLRAHRLLVGRGYAVPGVAIHLHKQIPMGAGLGGGSSDAAAALMALTSLLPDQERPGMGELAEAAAELGSDCPFFLQAQPAFVHGRGECVEPFLPQDVANFPCSSGFLAVLFPSIHVSTSKAFEGIEPREAPVDLRELLLLPVSEWKGRMANDFEPVVVAGRPEIAAAMEQLDQCGAVYRQMSGTGSAVWGWFTSSAEAERAALGWKSKDLQGWCGAMNYFGVRT